MLWGMHVCVGVGSTVIISRQIKKSSITGDVRRRKDVVYYEKNRKNTSLAGKPEKSDLPAEALLRHFIGKNAVKFRTFRKFFSLSLPLSLSFSL